MKYLLRRWLFLILFLTFRIQAQEPPNFTHYFLANGLEVVIIPNNRAPVVFHSLWYKVGSADSPENRSGLAHFLEHLLFNGTEKYPADSFKRIINDLGGSQNANTTWDRTVYFVTIAKEHLPLVMQLEADRMQNVLITETAVAKEKAVVLQERRSTVDARPEACLFEATNKAFFWVHPYGKPVIGYEEDIRQYSKEDALNFYQQWYAPNNAILIVAGDVSVEKLKPLIQETYGNLKTSILPKRQYAIEPNHRGATAKVEMRDPQIGYPFFQRIYSAPNFRTQGIHQEAVLTLLHDILGDSTFGRLNQSLVEKQKIAHFATAGYVGYFYDPYSFTLSAAPINTNDLLLLEASIESEVRRLISEGVSDAELTTAKEQWGYEYDYRSDSINGIANLFGESLSVGYQMKDIETWLSTLRSISADEVKLTAKEILGVGPSVTAYAFPVVQK